MTGNAITLVLISKWHQYHFLAISTLLTLKIVETCNDSAWQAEVQTGRSICGIAEVIYWVYFIIIPYIIFYDCYFLRGR